MSRIPSRTGRRRGIALAATTVVVGVLIGGPANAATSVTANPSTAPGGIVSSQKVEIPVTTGILGESAAYQVRYRTVDNHDAPVVTTTTILKSSVPWLGSGPRPLLSYQFAEDGLSTACAPSALATSGTPALAVDGVDITLALAQGWTVAIPDYEGPASEFLGAHGEPREVLDGVRAAQGFAPGGASSSSPVGLWGYSGGAFATALAAQIQTSYAPELAIAGVATGGLPGDLSAAFPLLSGTGASADILFLIAGLERAYPEEHLEQYLSTAAQQVVDANSSSCITGATGPSFATLSSLEAYPGALTTGSFPSWARSISPLGQAGAPAAPLYDYHGLLDEIAPLSADRQTALRYCAAGSPVEHVELPAEHETAQILGGPFALVFLSGRFAGLPTTSNCSSIAG
ncbi:lipase family protein [Frondihabitans cladoniiphilus]|uniref:Lipase family protein n=1 Tax=Frondihabitans cladoniiphilus TaxID=715785 RepID=A0ABP8VN30_9MICO